MLSPEERKQRLIDEIKISQVLDVKNIGSSKCPNCGKPNFSIYQGKFAKCFSASCEFNKAKTVIGCYKWKHNIADTWEAVKQMETEFGFTIGKNKPSEVSQLLEKCLDIYVDYLWSPKGKQALEYLRSRGFLDSIIKEYKIGYAPDFSCLTKKGIKQSALESINLYSEGREYYSKRIVLPIRNIWGDLVHFTGRYTLPITDDSIPKYKDTKNTEGKGTKDYLVFEENIERYLKSSNTLYMAEGYPDTLSLVQLGIPAVGSLGLERLVPHASKLKKFDNIVFMFDNDTFDADHPTHPLEYKSWNRVIPQLIDLQIVLPNTNFYTCLVPSNTLTKKTIFKPTKDINEWILAGELTGDEVKQYVDKKKKEFVSSLVSKWGSDIRQHLNLLKLIQVTNKDCLKAELIRYLPPSKSPIDYACEVLAA